MKGKILKRERKVLKERIEGHQVLVTKEEFQFVCSRCNQLVPKQRVIETTMGFV